MAMFPLFQDGGRLPSWICYVCVGTTHEGHLVVFIAGQNLVGIDAVVLIICMFFDFSSLAGKRLFRSQNWVFGGFDPLNGEAYQRNPQKTHPWAERRLYVCLTHARIVSKRLTHPWAERSYDDLYVIGRIDRQNRSTGATGARDEETKKERQREKLGIRPDVRLRRHQIEKKISMRLLYGVMCHRNWLSGFGDVVGVEICHLPNAVTIGLYNSLYCRTCGHSTWSVHLGIRQVHTSQILGLFISGWISASRMLSRVYVKRRHLSSVWTSWQWRPYNGNTRTSPLRWSFNSGTTNCMPHSASLMSTVKCLALYSVNQSINQFIEQKDRSATYIDMHE